MSSIFIDPVCRRRIQPQQRSRNGRLVDAQFQSDMAASLNQLLRHRTKCYGRFGGDVTGPVDDKLWRFASCSGPVTNAIVARVLMAPATQVTATSNPRVTMTVYDTSGNTLTSGSAHFGSNWGDVPQEIPKEWGACAIALDMSGHPNTQFRAEIRANDEARPISACVYETSLRPMSFNGYVPQAVSVGQSILDTDRSDLQRMAYLVWKYGGAHLFNWSSDTDATAPNWEADFHGTGPVNWVNGLGYNGQTTDQHPTFAIDNRNCNRKTKTTTPAVFELYASYAGVGGMVRLVDEAFNVYGTWSVTGAAAWQTPITVNLPADLRRYQFQVQGGGGNRVFLYAISGYRYGV